MRSSVIGLLALSAIGLISAPAFADEANVQTSEQVNTQIGDRNSSTQRTNQSNYSSRRDRNGNVGNAQDSFQDSLQEGNNNRNEQTVNQHNSNRRSRR